MGAAPWREAIDVFLEQWDGRRVNFAELREWLMSRYNPS